MGLSIVYRVTYLIYRFGLIYIVSLDHEDFSSIPYNISPLDTYNTLTPNLVRVPSLGYIIWSSYSPESRLRLLVYLYIYLVEYLCSPLIDLIVSYSAAPKLLLLYLALDYAYMPILLVEDPILSYTYSFKSYIDYNVFY